MSNREIGGVPLRGTTPWLAKAVGAMSLSGYRCTSEEGACSEPAEETDTPRPFEAPGCAAFNFFLHPLTFRDNYFVLSIDRFVAFV